jgi:hypothetical protein
MQAEIHWAYKSFALDTSVCHILKSPHCLCSNLCYSKIPNCHGLSKLPSPKNSIFSVFCKFWRVQVIFLHIQKYSDCISHTIFIVLHFQMLWWWSALYSVWADLLRSGWKSKELLKVQWFKLALSNPMEHRPFLLHLMIESKTFSFEKRRQNSSASTMAGYGLNSWWIWVPLPAEASHFYLHYSVQISCGTHPTSYLMGTGGLFL